MTDLVGEHCERHGLTPEVQAHLRGVRNAGDAWVVAADGNRYWGKFGAAGLLAVDPQRGILMQHRVEWSDHGGTWGVPGGAIDEGEDAISGAVREAKEEAGVPDGVVDPLFLHVIDRGGWTYTTVIAAVTTPFEPAITDPESVALEWVALDRVTEHALHPGFQASWPALRELIEAHAGGSADTTLAALRLEGVAVSRCTPSADA